MRNTFLKPLFDSVRHWYIPLIVGILFVLTGIFAFISPMTTFTSLAFVFSFSFILVGISEVIFSVSNSKILGNWGWHLVMGIITVIMGLMLVSDPNLSVNVLALYIGFLFLFRSIATVSFSLDLKDFGIKNWGYLLVLGVLGSIATLILLFNPKVIGISTGVLMGIIFLLIGTFSVSFSFQLRKIHRFSKRVKPELRKKYKKLKDEVEDYLDDLF